MCVQEGKKTTNTYRAQYYFRFQASSRVLGLQTLQIRGDYCSLLKSSKSLPTGVGCPVNPYCPSNTLLVPTLLYSLLETPEVQIRFSVEQNKCAGQDG